MDDIQDYAKCIIDFLPKVLWVKFTPNTQI